MRNMLLGSNLGLISVRQVAEGIFNHCMAKRSIVECRIMLSNKGYGYLFPLYLYNKNDKEDLFESSCWPVGKDGRVPNLNKKFVHEFAAKVKLDFVSEGRGDLSKTLSPEDIFHYIYAVLHSPEYRKRYAEFLKMVFPRIPLPTGRTIFKEFCKLGSELIALHLMESEILEDEKKWPAFDIEGSNVVEKGYPKYVAKVEEGEKGKVYINKDQYFEGVQPDVWEFHIGGYQVCEKWLKDRRGRELSYDDINHYQKIVVAIEETIRLMKEPCLSELFEVKKSKVKKLRK